VDEEGRGVLFWAAWGANLVTLRWLFDDVGVKISGVAEDAHLTCLLWNMLRVVLAPRGNAAEISSLLKVMVMLDDAPADSIHSL
jgi:hydroxyethylthiazole kinase-like sugar kinase family protein